jgi:predicted enzyme related to lactoylglutathione lyase
MANPFAHIELTTGDLGAAKKFYKKLFDWKLTDSPMGPEGGVYTMIAPGKGPGGGMQAQPMPNAPVTWLPYVEVDSVKKTLAKAEKAGAKIIMPVMDIGENGIIGIFVDPTGAMLGVWTQAKAAKKTAKKAAKKAAKKGR